MCITDADQAGDRDAAVAGTALQIGRVALATGVLVGVYPVLTQVPPKNLRSTTATFRPAPASRRASDGPDCPVPMMIASNLSIGFLVAVPDPNEARIVPVLGRGGECRSANGVMRRCYGRAN